MKASTPSATRRRILRLGSGALALVLVAPPLGAELRQPTRIFRIVELNPAPAPEEQQRVFRQALRELGYIPGENILIEDRFAAGSEERLRAYAAEAVRLQVDAIFAVSSAAMRASTHATKTIPIVGLDIASDPVASGFVASLARPGGNVTGIFVDLPGLFGKALELLTETIPGVTRLAVLRDPALDPAPLRATEVAARLLGLQLQIVEVRGPSDFDSAFSAIVEGRNGALMVLPSPRFSAPPRPVGALIGDLAIQHRLPTTSILSRYTESGLLMSYGPNLSELFRQAATYVDKILKGVKPTDLPVQRPMRFELVLNLKTAQALGLTIPPTVLFLADEVIR
jgi:putative ABC transport system substrate-binding protein